jgi:hypothetical protein
MSTRTQLQETVALQGSQAVNAGSATGKPIWQRLLQKSIFQFASPDLEAGYQTYLANHAGGYLLAFIPMFTLGWMQTLSCVATSRDSGGFTSPPGFIKSALLFLVPVVLLIAFLCVRSKAYAQNWRGINTAFMMVHVFSTNAFQVMTLWQQSCIAKGICGLGGGGNPSWLQTFATENVYLSIICLRHVLFSAGQIPDLFFTTLGLFLSMTANKDLCASPVWGPDPVTLSPALVLVPQKGSALLLGLLVPEPLVPLWLPQHGMSCSAVLGFWQVLGWWIGCLFILAREVASRKAFLKSAAAQFGPSVAQRAGAWPLGNAVTMHNTLCAVLSVCLAPGVFWAAALMFLQ